MSGQKKAILKQENNLFDKLKTMLDVLQKRAVLVTNRLSPETTGIHTSLCPVQLWPKLNFILLCAVAGKESLFAGVYFVHKKNIK